MNEWKEIKIGSVAKVLSGFAFKSADFGVVNSGMPVIKIKNIKNGDVDLSEADFVSESFLSLNSKYHIIKNDILISLTGSHLTQPNSVVGRVALYRKKIKSLLNQRAGKIIPDETKVDKFLLYAILSQDFIRDKIALRAKGAANQANISPSDVEDIEISLPPLSTQSKIASILSAYDDLIENNYLRIQLIEEALNHQFESCFSNSKNIETPILQIADFVKGFEPGANNYLEEATNDTIPFLRVGDLNKRESSTFIPKSIVKGRIANHEDILLSLDGTVGLVKIGLYGAYSSGVRKVVSKSPLHKAYIFAYLKSQHGQNTINTYARGSTILHAGSAIPKMKIRLPQEKLMNQFAAFANPSLELIVNLMKQNKFLQESRDILLPRLLNGTISVEKAEAKVIPIVVTGFPRVVSGITTTDLQAGIISMVIDLHQNNPKHADNLNHVKCEKISDLVERKLGISLGRVAVKDAAGPDDFNHLKKVEHRANMAGYFRNVPLPIGHTYEPLRSIQKAIDKVNTILTITELNAIEKMLREFLPFNLEHSELVATIYAGWNNLLLLGKQPTDEEIVFESRENWSKRKLGIPRENFFKTLEWMKRHDYIPEGKGQLVLKKEEVETKPKAKRK